MISIVRLKTMQKGIPPEELAPCGQCPRRSPAQNTHPTRQLAVYHATCNAFPGVGQNKVQNIIYNILMPNVQGEDILTLLSRRIQESTALCIDINAFVSCMKLFSPHYKWCILKSWLGAWTTSHKMHDADGAFGCILGCAAKDTWRH